MYWLNKQEKKSDILICQSQDLSKRFDDDQKRQQFQTLLQNYQLDENLKKTLNVIFCSQSDFSFSISNDSLEWDQNDEKQQNNDKFDNKSDDASVDRFNNRMNDEMNAEASDRIDSKMNVKTLEKVLKQLIKKNMKKNC